MAKSWHDGWSDVIKKVPLADDPAPPIAPGTDGRVSDDELADYVSNIGVGGYTQTEGRQFILDLCDARSTIAERDREIERLTGEVDDWKYRHEDQDGQRLIQQSRALIAEGALAAANARIRELEAHA